MPVSPGRGEDTRVHAERLAAEGARTGSRHGTAARAGLAEEMRLNGRYREAEAHAESALVAARSLGDGITAAALLVTLGHIHCAYEDREHARALYHQALDLATERGEYRLASRCREAIGNLHACQGRMDEAREAWQGDAAPAAGAPGSAGAAIRRSHAQVGSSVRIDLGLNRAERALF